MSLRGCDYHNRYQEWIQKIQTGCGAGHLPAIYLDTIYFIDNPFKIIKTEKEAGNGPVRPPFDPPMDTFTENTQKGLINYICNKRRKNRGPKFINDLITAYSSIFFFFFLTYFTLHCFLHYLKTR